MKRCILLLVSGSVMAATQLLDRIDIRFLPNGKSEFYQVNSGKRFVPYGYNYIVLDNVYPNTRSASGFHNLFDTAGANGWDANREKARRDLADMTAHGYTVVRVFLNRFVTGKGGPDAIAGSENPAIDEAYFSNLAEFLTLARDAGIYVTFVASEAPAPYIPLAPKSPLVSVKDRHADSNQMLAYVHGGMVAGMQAYLRDVVTFLIKAGVGDVLFSIEPEQELGFRSRYSVGKEIFPVKPWGEPAFGPWPPSEFKSDIAPSVYNLSPGEPDNFRFYHDVSYFYCEQLLKAVRSVKGAENLLVTFSSIGSTLVLKKLKTIGYDERSWFFPVYAAAQNRLGEKDRHFYLDLHIYPENASPEAARDPSVYGALTRICLASFGLADPPDGEYKTSAQWRRESISIPMIVGEFGARKPGHPKHTPEQKQVVMEPDDAVLLLNGAVSEIAKAGFSGCLLWLYGLDSIGNKNGAPAMFFTPGEYPQMLKGLSPKESAFPFTK